MNNKINIACKNYNLVFNNSSKFVKFSKLDEWLLKESCIFVNETKTYIPVRYPKFKRGSLIKVDFGVNVGSEFSFTHFAIVLNKDDSVSNDNITIIPITSKDGYKKIPVGKLILQAIPQTKKYNLDCYADLTQIKTISKKRVLNQNLRYVCDSTILNLLDKEITSYLTNYIVS